MTATIRYQEVVMWKKPGGHHHVKILHNAIHFSNKDGFLGEFIERKPNDTCPWRY